MAGVAAAAGQNMPRTRGRRRLGGCAPWRARACASETMNSSCPALFAWPPGGKPSHLLLTCPHVALPVCLSPCWLVRLDAAACTASQPAGSHHEQHQHARCPSAFALISFSLVPCLHFITKRSAAPPSTSHTLNLHTGGLHISALSLWLQDISNACYLLTHCVLWGGYPQTHAPGMRKYRAAQRAAAACNNSACAVRRRRGTSPCRRRTVLLDVCRLLNCDGTSRGRARARFTAAA